jgi:hypothetical protein
MRGLIHWSIHSPSSIVTEDKLFRQWKFLLVMHMRGSQTSSFLPSLYYKPDHIRFHPEPLSKIRTNAMRKR